MVFSNLSAVASTSIRSQVLGHSRADIYDRYYRSQVVRQDVQAAFLETPEQKALISAMGNMSLTMDPNAPKGLSDLSHEDQQAVECDQYLVAQRERRSRMAEQIKKEYGSISKAKGTSFSVEYNQLKTSIRTLRNKLLRDALNTKRRQYFENIDTDLIERQLRGPPQFEVDKDDEQEVYFGFNERTRLATNLFPIDSDISHRLDVIADLVSLCNFRLPRNRKLVKPDAPISPDVINPGLQCLFCLGDCQLGDQGKYRFANPFNLLRHQQTYHFPFLSEPFNCPYPRCFETFRNVEEFQQHARLHYQAVVSSE
jgi:hypothetical protein